MDGAVCSLLVPTPPGNVSAGLAFALFAPAAREFGPTPPEGGYANRFQKGLTLWLERRAGASASTRRAGRAAVHSVAYCGGCRICQKHCETCAHVMAGWKTRH